MRIFFDDENFFAFADKNQAMCMFFGIIGLSYIIPELVLVNHWKKDTIYENIMKIIMGFIFILISGKILIHTYESLPKCVWKN